jgi:hypothetical protein
VDTGGRVERFQRRYAAQREQQEAVTARRAPEGAEAPAASPDASE